MLAVAYNIVDLGVPRRQLFDTSEAQLADILWHYGRLFQCYSFWKWIKASCLFWFLSAIQVISNLSICINIFRLDIFMLYHIKCNIYTIYISNTAFVYMPKCSTVKNAWAWQECMSLTRMHESDKNAWIWQECMNLTRMHESDKNA